MSGTVQAALIILGILGAAGTWFRAWVAYQEHKAAEHQRQEFREGR